MNKISANITSSGKVASAGKLYFFCSLFGPAGTKSDKCYYYCLRTETRTRRQETQSQYFHTYTIHHPITPAHTLCLLLGGVPWLLAPCCYLLINFTKVLQYYEQNLLSKICLVLLVFALFAFLDAKHLYK